VAFVRLANFGASGLALDPFEEGLDTAWSTLSSVDTSAGELTSPGQEAAIIGACPITPKWQYFYEGGQGGLLFVSDGSEVWATEGITWVQVVAGWHGGLVTYCVFLGSLIVNSSTDGPSYWNATGGTTWGESAGVTWSSATQAWGSADFSGIIPLPGWFSGATCLQMVSYKNFLVAIAVDDPVRGAALQPYLVAWSGAAPAGGLPTVWDPAPDNLAGDTLVQDMPGVLSGASVMRDALMIYKTDSIYRMSFLEGSALVMRVERVHRDDGIDHPYAMASIEDIHYLVTRAGMMAFDGQQASPVDFLRVQEEIRQRFRTSFPDNDIIYCAAYPGRKEIWVAYRDVGASEFFGILKLDLQQKSFSVHNYSGKQLTAICPGSLRPAFTDSLGSWASQGSALWSDFTDTPWSGGIGDPLLDTMLLAQGSNIARYVAQADPVWLDGSSKTATAIRYGVRLSAAPARSIVRGIYPYVRGSGTLLVTLGKTWAPWQAGGPQTVQWGAQRAFRPGVDRYLPMREVGDVFAIKIESNDGEPWRLAGIGLEYDTLGAVG
jgi:hypothetical protein